MGGCATVVPDDTAGYTHRCEHRATPVWPKQYIRVGLDSGAHSCFWIGGSISHIEIHAGPRRRQARSVPGPQRESCSGCTPEWSQRAAQRGNKSCSQPGHVIATRTANASSSCARESAPGYRFDCSTCRRMRGPRGGRPHRNCTPASYCRPGTAHSDQRNSLRMR